MRLLNLGAGNRILDGAVNHDRIKHRPEIDVVHDLNDLPWPWDDNSFDKIAALAVFEHLVPDLVQVLNECWRILAPGGEIVIKVPYWNSDNSYKDPTHRWFFSLGAFDQFDPDTERGRAYAFYTERKWKIVKPPRFNDARTSIYCTLQVRK